METEPNVVAKYSSTFVKTDQVLPVVDITWDYNSYRFKTFESCLRNCYGDRYPPGEVVLNSMQLNLLDSHTNVPMNVAGLFDFMKEESEPRLNTVSRKLEIEYLNPLDHFVTKQPGRPETVERFTETDEQDRWYNTAKSQQENDIGPVITGREKNQPNRRSSRKIEAPCKCYLSSSRRVCGTNDSWSGRNPLETIGEHGRWLLPGHRLGQLAWLRRKGGEKLSLLLSYSTKDSTSFFLFLYFILTRGWERRFKGFLRSRRGNFIIYGLYFSACRILVSWY